MALISLREWRETTFTGKRPTLRACQRWAKQGHIVGAKKIGALWFVDEEIEKRANGNALVARVLAG